MTTAEAFEPLVVQPAAIVIAFVLGTLFGSFANVCIYRWPPTDEHPKGRSVVHPGSHCGVCGKPVRWYDNVPILAWLWLRGRCRDCKTQFSARYLLVEAATGMLFAALWWTTIIADAALEPLPIRSLRFVVYAAFVFTLVVITFIDLDHKLILDRVTYPAIPIFYLLSLPLPEHSWQDGLIGAAVGYLTVRLIADGYYFLTKREGMGYGDGKLLAVIGALLGWKAVVVSIFLGSLLGSVIGIAALSIARRRAPPATEAEGDAAPLRHAELPFGPFLVAGALFYLFAQSWLEIRFFGLYS